MKYKSQGIQLSFEEFQSSLNNLPKSNRWVAMGDNLPWEGIEKIYNSKLNNEKSGAGNISARTAVGALIIKHKMNLSDEETILLIQENIYMQYMLGLSAYTDKPVFDSSLFVTIRKRLQIEDLNAFTQLLLSVEKAKEENGKEQNNKDDDDKDDKDQACVDADSKVVTHQGDLKIDATCSDAEVRYPTDLDLLMDGSRVINRYIAKLCLKHAIKPPVTFLKETRTVFLGVIKFRKKSKKKIHDCKLLMLPYLQRDIKSFMKLISDHGTDLFGSLKRHEQKIALTIMTMYKQQEQMFKTKVNRCDNRIVSIFQAHLRPIVRGKSKNPTEFGAKIGVSVVNGYTFIDHHSWNAYNEAEDLKTQIQLYKERMGCYPARVYADKIYMNRANRNLMTDLGIEAMGKPLGRPMKDPPQEYKDKMRQAVSDRNEVEATFGTAKRVYRADNIRAKLPQTANCWTGMCYFVKNVMKFLKKLFHASFFVQYYDKNRSNSWMFSIGRTDLLIYEYLIA